MKIQVLKSVDVKRALKCMKKADDRFDSYDNRRIARYIKKPNHLILMASIKGKFVGYCGLMMEDDDIKIERLVDINKFLAVSWIGVLPEYKEMGIGSKLLKASEKYTKRFKTKGIWLDCRKDKVPFYEKNGYKKVGYFMKKGQRQYVMLKRLK